MNRMPRLCFLFLQSKDWSGFVLRDLLRIWHRVHFCAYCLGSFAKLHSNLKDSNRKSKVFLTRRLVSLVLVSQTVIFAAFISAAGLMLCVTMIIHAQK